MNPGPFILAALVGALAWMALRKPASTDESTSCEFYSDPKIDAWGKARELYIIWIETGPNTYPTWDSLQAKLVEEWPQGGPTTADTVVITSADGRIWSYVTGAAVENAALRADFCAFRVAA